MSAAPSSSFDKMTEQQRLKRERLLDNGVGLKIIGKGRGEPLNLAPRAKTST